MIKTKNYILITRFIMISMFVLFLYFFRITFVNGCSMKPTLKETDFLICNTFDTTPEIGDIVVVKPLICTNDYIIKRVTDIKDNQIFLEGDNKEHSYDSRNFGWIDKENVLGVVLFK